MTFPGLQADNGTYLVGGGRNPTVQEVKAANTVIKYTRKKAKYKDVLKIEGPTDAFLRVMVSKSYFFLILCRFNKLKNTII